MCQNMCFKQFFLVLLVILLAALGIGMYNDWIPTPKALMRAYAAKKMVDDVKSSIDIKKFLTPAQPAEKPAVAKK